MRDIEAEEMWRRLWLYERIREVVYRYGFETVEPSTVENLETLEAKSGAGIRNEIYWFKDKAGRDLGLRFDLTVGLSRMIANRYDLPEPIKFASIGGNWRYDEPQFARYRYFTQWDVEIFGSNSPVADAEVISVGADILRNVGLKDYSIRISNRKLTEAYLKQLDVNSQEQLEQSLRIIDKVRKANRQQLQSEFKTLSIDDTTIEKIFSYVSLNGDPNSVLDQLRRLPFTEDNGKNGIEELEELADALEALGRLNVCMYDMSIVRGIGYYDGIVFEGFDKEGDVGSIFGGGRYDKLCRIYGKRDIPATGVAGGVERLMISLERAGLFPQERLGAKVFIATVEQGSKLETIRLAQTLRDNGIGTDLDLKSRALGKQIEYVNSAKIPYLIVLGPREIQSRTVKVKEMATGTETQASFDDLVGKLRELN